MAFYDDQAATAAALLAKYGKTFQLRRTTVGTYDPITGTTTGASTQDFPTVGIHTKITADYIATHQVEQGDKMILIDASQVPQMTDKLVDGGAVWQVIDIDVISPADTPIAYRVRVHK